MAEVLEKTGKTVEEAYQAALAELGLPESRVSYEVIEEPSKGFLGIIGGKLAKVRVTVRELSPLEKAENFLKEIFSSMQGNTKQLKDPRLVTKTVNPFNNAIWTIVIDLLQRN